MEPLYYLPCSCKTSVCQEHLDSSKNLKLIECLNCHKKYDLKGNKSEFIENESLRTQIESYSCLNDEEIKLTLEETLIEIEDYLSKLNLILGEFSVNQYEHFANIKRDIDIKRETFIQNLYEVEKQNDTEQKLEKINRQSDEMIKKVESTEEAFRKNFELKIKPQLIGIIDVDLEKKKIKETFRNSNLNKDFHENLNKLYQVKLNDLRKKYLNFHLFDCDLKRNELLESQLTPENLVSHLGKLDLSNSFLDFKNILNVIVGYNNSKDIKIFNFNNNSAFLTLTGHSKGIFSLQSVEKNRLISGSYDRSPILIIFFNMNSILFLNILDLSKYGIN